MKLYLATSNPAKVREFLASGLAVELLPGLSGIPSPEETGTTFAENAALKAVYYSLATGEAVLGTVLAEDSGLCVDSLDGGPGVYSARYAERAGAGSGDEANNRHLLAQLRNREDRSAHYVAVIAVARAGRLLASFEGKVHGEIIDEARGAGGFGYDPHFWHPPSGRTFAELRADEKLALSHRGKAIAALSLWLRSSASR